MFFRNLQLEKNCKSQSFLSNFQRSSSVNPNPENPEEQQMKGNIIFYPLKKAILIAIQGRDVTI